MKQNLKVYYDYITKMQEKLKHQNRRQLGLWNLPVYKSDHNRTFEIFQELTGLNHINDGMKLMILNNIFPIEIWKRIVIDDMMLEYEVSNYGNVRSLKRDDYLVMKPHLISSGYLVIKMRPYSNKLIHRLVAVSFIPNPENKEQVNHDDGCKTNNFWLNLEWNTCSENVQHAIDTGLTRIRGEDSYNNRYSEKIIRKACELLEKGKLTQAEINRRFKFPKNYIYHLRDGSKWKHVTKDYDLTKPLIDQSGERNPNLAHDDSKIHTLCQLIEIKPSITDIELSRKTGISRGYISNIRRGANRIDISSQYNILKRSSDQPKSDDNDNKHESSSTILETGVHP